MLLFFACASPVFRLCARDKYQLKIGVNTFAKGNSFKRHVLCLSGMNERIPLTRSAG